MKLNLLLILTLLVCPAFANATIKMAITVDDLPRHGALATGVSRTEVTQKMIQALKKYKVPEVYGFINAKKLEGDREGLEVLKLWSASGYPLGNHTFSHADLNKVSIEEFQKEIDQNEKTLTVLQGNSDWRYFRYPYLQEGNVLEKRNAIRDYLKSKKYKIAEVTVDFEDCAWNDPYAHCLNKCDQASIDALKKSYLENAEYTLLRAVQISDALFKRPISHVLLLHIGGLDAELIDSLLKKYQSMGVEFISLNEASRDPIYDMDPGAISDSGMELLYQVAQSRGLKMHDLGVPPYSGVNIGQLNQVCAK